MDSRQIKMTDDRLQKLSTTQKTTQNAIHVRCSEKCRAVNKLFN